MASSSARAISVASAADVAGVPFNRSGTDRHCAMRWASSSSRPRMRARRRLPFAALAAARAASAVAPSRISTSAIPSSLSPFSFSSTQREATVSRAGGTSSAVSRKIVRDGRLFE